MNTKSLLALAAFAALASAGAHADEYNGGDRVLQFQSSRARAEVLAEARVEAKSHSTIPAGSKVSPGVASSTDASTVRAQAVQALRLGQISHGEASYI